MATNDQDYHFALEEGLQWWITNGTVPCWEELISAVENCGDKDVATTMKRRLDIKNEDIYYEQLIRHYYFNYQCSIVVY